jgi:hypothetical protein
MIKVKSTIGRKGNAAYSGTEMRKLREPITFMIDVATLKVEAEA